MKENFVTFESELQRTFQEKNEFKTNYYCYIN